ncbi:MAG: hypothetical protein HC802_21970 [Caldilineaceae bacterium]|nr:hypothetical protein [Caldilineaceae bacterium]
MLTKAQKRHFVEEGYLKIPNVAPKIMIDDALRAVNHSIGYVGMGGEDMANNRSAFFCAELLTSPLILALFHNTPAFALAEELMGEGNVLPLTRAKPYPRFPELVDVDDQPMRGHLDGIGNGTNGMPKGYYNRGFSAFAVIYLADVLEPYAGNFTVWPKSHRFLADYFQREGHEVLANGMPRLDFPEAPVMLTANAGDLILAHSLIYHTGGINTSPNVRHAVIARFRHKECDAIGKEGYTDLWREWPGVHEVV